ncbi:exosortase/archaeosortase family protein [Parasediminibacterium sp. JCM 36343]|uniref:exosortase/archaeosortase family protein n=1 Tax=Parasediminibacterium sp. JCM 36343 TaxID=3374279 RepID=UPI00397DE81E
MDAPLGLLERIKLKWINRGPASRFVVNAALCVVAWRSLYVYILQPIQFPDKILTRFIGHGTLLIINFFKASSLPAAYCMDARFGDGVVLLRNQHAILTIGNACNGLELMMIYAGVIALLPGKFTVKAKYISIGFLMLMLANMIRCAGLEWIYEFYRSMFETTHHYLFTLVMYVIIFAGWVMYINKVKRDAKG